MARFIASARNPLWPAQEPEMRELFGVKGGKWPAQGCPVRFIQGIAVHVLPSDHISLRKGPGVAGKRQVAHRVIAACPDCGKAVSAGRLRQHKCGAKPRRGRRFVDRTFQTAELNQARVAKRVDLLALARAALATEYDTQEHEDAHNAFNEAAGNAMTRKQRLEWDRWCLKATDVEIVQEALRILGLNLELPA